MRKFILQMLYGILTGNMVHLSEIARSFGENILKLLFILSF